MKKMRNRKGFTLIEMLIVIAIIAVLVSVIIPVVSGGTDKASAATNAANLRSVEGEIVTMMLADPYAFGDKSVEQGAIDFAQGALEAGGDDLNAAKERLATAEANLANFNVEDTEEWKAYLSLDAAARARASEYTTAQTNYNTAAAAVTHSECTTSSIRGITTTKHTTACYKLQAAQAEAAAELATALAAKEAADKLLPEDVDAFKAQLNEQGKATLQSIVDTEQAVVDRLTAENNKNLEDLNAQEIALYKIQAENGVITLPNGTTLEAPVSKAVSSDSVNIDKDVEMVIYVNPNTYTAYAYYTGDAEYGVSDFAAIAE